MADDKQVIDAKAAVAKTEAVTAKKYEPGFRADSTAYPGVDPDTGERKAVTWAGLREEFGEREGARLYNNLAVAGFGGVQPSRPALSLLTLQDKSLRPQGKHETAEEYAKVAEKFRARRAKVETLMADAVAGKLKGE